MKNTLIDKLRSEVVEEFRREILDELKQEFVEELKDNVRAELYDELCWADLMHYQLETIQQFYDDEYPKLERALNKHVFKLDDYCEAAFAKRRLILDSKFSTQFQMLEKHITEKLDGLPNTLDERIARIVDIQLTQKIREVIMKELLKDFRGNPDQVD